MARSLHGEGVVRVLALSVMMVGCVLPPDYSVDTTDAGANSAPAILSVRADLVELPELKTVTFEQGVGTLEVTLHDTDLDDKLYGRIFVDYNNPDATPPRASCESAGSTVQRSCTLPLTGLCLTADIGQTRVMQVVVFDRELLETGQSPLYQAMLPPGISTSRTFFLRCQEKSI